MDIAELLRPFATKNKSKESKQQTSTIQFTATNNHSAVSGNSTVPSGPVVTAVNKFPTYHKKPNLQFVRDPKAIATNRKVDYKEKTKESRFNALNKKRGIIDNMMDSILGTKSTLKEPAEKPKDSRMEQLQRWKKEKETLLKQQAAKVPPPFRAGAAHTNFRPVPTSASANAVPIKLANAHPITTATVRQKPHNAVQTERRVTRAMASANNAATTAAMSASNAGLSKREANAKKLEQAKPSASAPSVVQRATIGTQIQPETKDASINTDPPDNLPQSVFIPTQSNIIPEQDENVPPPVKSISLENLSKKTGGICHSPARKKGGLCHSPAVQKLGGGVTRSPVIKNAAKKTKQMQLDAVYSKYHGIFMAEYFTLKNYSEEWGRVLAKNGETLPDSVVCDIESSMGQAKLLMESKLPQFADLLQSYLSRAMVPFPTLACDLEGWWDVASISIDKVKDRFVKLEQFSNNGWKTVDSSTKIKESRIPFTPIRN